MFKKRLRELRVSKGYTLEELANMYNKRFGGKLNKGTLSRYENGLQEPLLTTVKNLAMLFAVSTDYLLGNEDTAEPDLLHFDNIFPIETKKFPLLGEIACGEPVFAEQNFETFVEAAANINADFCLRAKGDSMIGARIFDGDIVFIHRQPQVENGQIAAVIIDDEATLKRVTYFPEKDMLILKPENPQYQDLIYAGTELNQVRILGRAVAFQSLVR